MHLPVLKHIKKKLAMDNADDTMLAIEVKEIIWSDLENRYVNAN